MTPSWQSNFLGHELWAKCTTLRTRVTETDRSELAEEDHDTLDYILAVTDLLLLRRDSTDPLQVTRPMLVRSATAVDNVLAYLENWQEGTYTNTQVDEQTEALIDTLAYWPAVPPDVNGSVMLESSRRLAEVTDGLIEDLREKATDATESFDSLQESVSTLEQRASAHDGSIAKQLSSLNDEASESLVAHAQAWEKERLAQVASAEAVLTTLAELEANARNTVNATASAAVATSYGKYARNKTIAAWICDVAAALIGAAGVGAILLHLYRESVEVDGDVGLSLTRLAASLGTLGIAALVAHRGHDHHVEARAAKRADLRVRQIGPFVANLPETVRTEITVELAHRLFIEGQLDEALSPESSSADFLQRMRQLLERERSAESVTAED